MNSRAILRILSLLLVGVAMLPLAALAQDSEALQLAKAANLNFAYLAAGLGAGLAVIGAGYGIGRLASAAMEGTARQPSAGGDIRTTMIIAAALIEGATLFAEVVCILMALK